MNRLEDEIRAALRARAPLEAEKDEWVQAALAHADAPAPRRRLRAWPFAAAAAVLALVVWGVTRPRAQAPAASFLDAEAEREANERVLASVATLRRLKNAPQDHYAVIAGGRDLFVGPDLDALLQRADKAHPSARHRFVFPLAEGLPPLDKTFASAPGASGPARFEVPGLAIVETPDGLRRACRRHLVGGKDAVGAELGLWYAGRVWHAEAVVADAAPLLLLVVAKGARTVPAAQLDRLPPELLDRFGGTGYRVVNELTLPDGRTVPLRPGSLNAVALAVMRDGEQQGLVMLREDTDPEYVAAYLEGVLVQARPPPAEGTLDVTFDRLASYEFETGKPIPARIRAFDGRDVVVQGFMIPIRTQAGDKVTELVLVRSHLACCFGVPPKMNEWIHVVMRDGATAPYSLDVPVAAHGKLAVGEVHENGALMSIYRMTADEVRTATAPSRRSLRELAAAIGEVGSERAVRELGAAISDRTDELVYIADALLTAVHRDPQSGVRAAACVELGRLLRQLPPGRGPEATARADQRIHVIATELQKPGADVKALLARLSAERPPRLLNALQVVRALSSKPVAGSGVRIDLTLLRDSIAVALRDVARDGASPLERATAQKVLGDR